MLGKLTLAAFTALLLIAAVLGFAQSTTNTLIANKPPERKKNLKPHAVIAIPDDEPDDSRVLINRSSTFDPTDAQIRDQALLDAITELTRKGDDQLAQGDTDAALATYRQALDKMENSLLGINSYEVRFGIAMVTPPIAQIYQIRNTPRADAAKKRLDTWKSCGLMATTDQPKRTYEPETCGDTLTFDLFRAQGG